jgi:adenosylhomocysteine nucleosidase
MKKIIFVMLLLLTTLSFGKDRILLQGAMDLEVDKFVKEVKNVKKYEIQGFTFWTGRLNEKDVVISKTEVGMVNATVATMLAIEKFNPTIIINQGTAGGHAPNLHRFDIVLGEKSFNMGSTKSDRKEVGEGTNPNEWNQMTYPTTIIKNGKEKEYDFFYGNEKLMKVAETIKYTKGKVVKGTIGTADQWNRELDRINYLNKTYGTLVEEMETSAVAQVAEIYNIPFLGVRILSNTEIFNEEFDPKSGEYCQDFVIDLVGKL